MRVAIIPARGGSKRIPRKNLRDFAGKPILAYSIECALHSSLFDRIVVSTDDAEVARVAQRYGAEVPFMRPDSLADDHTGVTPVVGHAIEWLRRSGFAPTYACCIYATAPFMAVEDLRSGLKLLESGAWQYALSATTYGSSVFRAFRRQAEGGLEMLFPEHFPTRSQDLPEVLHDAAQFCWGKAQAWVDNLRIFAESSTIVQVPRWRVQDIDTEEDWIRAEALAVALQSQAAAPFGSAQHD